MADRKDETASVAGCSHRPPIVNPKRNNYAFVCAGMASMASVLLGYDIGVMSGAVIFIQKDFGISDVKVEILVGIVSLYAIIGSIAAGQTSDWVGRRYTMGIAAAFFLVGAVLMGLATNYAFLMCGRFFAGVGIGFAGLIASVYTAEISPTASRGCFTSFPEVLDAEIHLDAMNLGETIKEGNATSIQETAKAMIFLCHHLHERLKMEYLTIKDPCILWKNLKQRYDHQKTVILPKARYEWMHLRLQDFKSEQYREKGFKQYPELISCLLVTEQNNELLMKNHESRPTGTTPVPEVNAVNFNNRGRGRGRGRDRGRGRNSYYFRGGHSNHPNFKRTTRKDDRKGKALQDKNSKDDEHKCFRCGMTRHWSPVCRKSKHLVDLYQASLKEKREKCGSKFCIP